MARLYLVRHGRAAAGIAENTDPGLDELGHRQAAATAEELAALPVMPLFTSPLLRARETGEPLARRWNQQLTVESRVAEIPFPTSDLAARARWLQAVMPGRWSSLDDYWQQWRNDVVACLLEQPRDCIFFSHFIAINAAVGAACADDRMVVFRPDNASITVLSNDPGSLTLLQLGGEAETKVN
ncbi:MAG: histidine phosphatase family protein [Pseudomonadales bacterium]